MTVARDVQQAVKILSEQKFGVWSLDHDIGYQMLCEDCDREWKIRFIEDETFTYEVGLREGCKHKEDGTTLVQWAVKNITEWPELILIHSANNYAAERMRDILKTKFNGVLLIARYDKEFLRKY